MTSDPSQSPIARRIVYALGVEVLVLFAVDIWLGKSKRPMLTDAIRQENSATGWLIAAYAVGTLAHLFLLPKVDQLEGWCEKR